LIFEKNLDEEVLLIGPLTGRRNTKYGGHKRPFLRRRKKRVDEKVVPFVKLVGPMENPRRYDKENGLTFSDWCT